MAFQRIDGFINGLKLRLAERSVPEEAEIVRNSVEIG